MNREFGLDARRGLSVTTDSPLRARDVFVPHGKPGYRTHGTSAESRTVAQVYAKLS